MKRRSKDPAATPVARKREASLRTIARRYFDSEVFHDSEIRVEKVDIAAREVHLRLCNNFALNRAFWIQNRHKIDPSDFATNVVVKGVRLFQIRDAYDGEKRYWMSCRFTFQNNHARLQVRFTRGLGVGRLLIHFEGIEIEDISKRISKYTPGGAAGRWIEYPASS